MPVAPVKGSVIAGKYRLIDRVGSGGMSEVYRAEAIDSSRIVALKLLLPHRADDAGLTARLFHEAKSVSRVRHPAIVEVLDAGQSEVGPFIAMEYLVGESAARIAIEFGKFRLPAALATLLPVLDALALAHDAGIVHRDLKPGNVFYSVTPEGDVAVKLLDFGVAKTFWSGGSATPRTSTGVVMGTPDYLSPEQANGEATIDGRSDLFAAGVVLFELLTCVRPFHAPTAVATAYRISHAKTPLLRDYGGPSDSTLQAILERALAKRREERYANARELAAELRSLAPSDEDLRYALRDLVKPERFLTRRDRPGSAERLVFPARSRPQERASAISSQRRIEPVSFRPPADSIPDRPSTPLSFRPTPATEKIGSGRHARGAVLRAIDSYVSHVFGADARARTLAALPREAALEFEYATVQAIVFYELEIVTKYIETVTRDAGRNNPTWARAAGGAAVYGELGPILRAALRKDEPSAVVRRVVAVMSRLFDFGSWDIDAGPAVLCVRGTDLDALVAPLRMWLVGVLEGSLSAAGVRARSMIAKGDASFARDLVVEVVPG